MAEDFILSYENGEATILSRGVFFHTPDKPDLSFSFDILCCETPTNVLYRMVGDNQFLLTDEQVEECRQYCEDFYENGDYAVFAYDPADDNIYQGYIKKSECVEKGFKWVVDNRPESMAAVWDDSANNWKIIYAAIHEDGTLAVAIDRICTACVLLLTKEEYEAFPKPEHDTDQWDFEKSEWVDKRNLEHVKKDALLELRNKFDLFRWHAAGCYISGYERETWRTQLEEARSYLADNTADTPYIDAFLAARTDDEVPTKAALVSDIIENNSAFVLAMAPVNARQWGYQKRIEAAENGYAVDAIVEEIRQIFDEESKK